MEWVYVAIGLLTTAVVFTTMNANRLERSNCGGIDNAGRIVVVEPPHEIEVVVEREREFGMVDLFRMKIEAMKNPDLDWTSLSWLVNDEGWYEVNNFKDAMNRYIFEPVPAPASIYGSPYAGRLLGIPVEIDPRAKEKCVLLKVPTHCDYCKTKIGKGTSCRGCGAPYPSKYHCSFCGAGKPTRESKCSNCGGRDE